MTDPDEPLDAAYNHAVANTPSYPYDDTAERDVSRARRGRRQQPVDLDVSVGTEQRLRQLADEEFDGADLDVVLRHLLDEHQTQQTREQR